MVCEASVGVRVRSSTTGTSVTTKSTGSFGGCDHALGLRLDGLGGGRRARGLRGGAVEAAGAGGLCDRGDRAQGRRSELGLGAVAQPVRAAAITINGRQGAPARESTSQFTPPWGTSQDRLSEI